MSNNTCTDCYEPISDDELAWSDGILGMEPTPYHQACFDKMREGFANDVKLRAEIKRAEIGDTSSKITLSELNSALDPFVVGEEDTRHSLILILLGGKLTMNAQPTSKNIMVNDESGAGKDFLVHQVLRLLPPEDVVKRKRISETTFTYWHNAKVEPDWTWDGKIFYNEDVSNSVLNSDVFKVMSSSDGENTSTIIVKQLPQDIVTRGKPVMIITIYNAHPGKELLRRFPIVHMNVTEEQTRAILERKAQQHVKGDVPTIQNSLIARVRALNRVKVRVPFAERLPALWSARNVIIRTHFDRFCDYIKFSAAIHQAERKRDGENYIIANGEDYEEARKAMEKTTTNVLAIPLTRKQERILKIFEDNSAISWWSVGDLEPLVTFISQKTLYTELDKLAEWGFLEKTKEDRESSKKPVMVYRYVGIARISLPKWSEISTSNTTTTINSNVTNDSSDIKTPGTIETIETNVVNLAYEEKQNVGDSQ